MESAEIKSFLSIERLLKHYGVEKVSNKLYFCPFHESGGKRAGHKPSLMISKQSAYCMGAQNCLKGGGDIFSFIAKKEGLDCTQDFKKVKEVAMSIAGLVETKEEGFSPEPRFLGIKELDEKQISYLISRGISLETANEFKLKAKFNYILFPQTINGEFVGYKGISVPKTGEKSKIYFDVTKTPEVWYEPKLREGKILFFVEGEKDYLRLYEQLKKEDELNNFTIATVPYGANFVPKNLSELVSSLQPKAIYIAYDNDKSGESGSKKLGHELAKIHKNVFILKFSGEKPSGYDLSDFLNEGLELSDLMALEKERLGESLFSKGDQFFSAAELIGPPEQIPWLIEGFLAKGKLGVLVSTGGVGKSWFLLQLAVAVASGKSFFGMTNPNKSSRVLFISGEEDRSDIHRRICQIQAFYKETLHEPLSLKEIEGLYFYCARGSSLLLAEGTQTLCDLESYIDREKPSLIVLDPMIRFFNGDENSSTQMTRFVEILEGLVRRGTTLIFAHHSSKISSGQLDQHSSRGSSAIIDGVRWNFTMHSISRGMESSYIFEESGEDLPKNDRDRYICGSITKCNSFKPIRKNFTFIKTSCGPLALSEETLIRK